MPQTDGIKLSPKQKLFCEEYAKTKNATQSAINAGYSEKTAGIIGFENLKKPKIVEYLDELYAEALGNAPEGTIATLEEIMEFHTNVMRNKLEDASANITERQKSANSLFEMLERRDSSEDGEVGVIIMPDVKVVDYE
jgi:phage terminase small subunit